MLHHRYKNLYTSLAAFAFAGAAWGQSAASPVVPVDGSVPSIVCLPVSSGESLKPGLEDALLRSLEEIRRESGAGSLTRLASLDAAARLEACSLLEQLTQGSTVDQMIGAIDPVRISERQHLLGAFGTSIVVVGSDAGPAETHQALTGDDRNLENMLRRSFDHSGIAIVDAGARMIVVQVLAKVDGAFAQPLPKRVSSNTDMQMVMKSSDMHPVGWSLEAVSGEVIARGRGTRIGGNRDVPMEGYLNLDVAVGPEIFTLRGPYVQVESN